MRIALLLAPLLLVAGAAFGGETPPAPAPKADVPVGKALYAEHFAFVRLKVPEGLGGPAKQAGKGGWCYCSSDSKGRLFVAEPQNEQVHMIDTDGTDRIIAGDGKKGFRDGPGDRARFDFGCGGYEDLAVQCDDDGNVYVSDGLNFRLRKLSQRPDGTWRVTTVSGGGDVHFRAMKKGEWVAATDLQFGCASKFGLKRDGSAAYYAQYGGIYKVLLKENKATLLISGDDLRAQKINYPSWHVGGAHVTEDGVFYWMPGGAVIYRFDEKTGKVERFAGGGPRRTDGKGLLDSGFHTVHATYSPNASVIYTGGADEYDVRRIYKGKVMHLLKDGSFAPRQGPGHSRDTWQLNAVKHIDGQGRLYTVCAPHTWPRWIVRVTFEKE